MQLTQTQRAERLQKVLKGGFVALLQYIDDLEERVATMNPDFQKFMKDVKGKDADPEELAIILKNDPFFMKLAKPKYGEDFSLTDADIENMADYASKKIVKTLNLREIAQNAASMIEVPVVEKIIEKQTKVIEKIPIITNEIVEKAVTDQPEVIRDKVESLPEGKRIDIEYIDGVEDLFERLFKKYGGKGKGQMPYGVGGGTGGGRIVRYHDLSASLDGVTKTFALPANYTVLSVQSSSFPNILRPTVDYTVTSQSITFTSEISASSTLATGQTLIVLYSE